MRGDRIMKTDVLVLCRERFDNDSRITFYFGGM